MSEHFSLKNTNTILTFIFGLVIFTPLALGIIQKDRITSQIEKRNLTPRPQLPKNISELIAFPNKFNAYYADHFGLREFFTKTYFKISHKLNGQPASEDVTIGKDGWMFLGSIKPGYTGYGDPMGDITNINLYTEEELKEFAQSLTKIKNWLHKQNIEYIYTIAPNKHTVYFDKLPDYISKKNKYSATEQLISYLKAHTDITIVELGEALSKAKKDHQLYYKTDTHWNYYGANIAQFEIMKAIEQKFPGKISASLHPSTQFINSKRSGGDLALFANISNLSEDDPHPVFVDNCSKGDILVSKNDAQPFTTTCSQKKLNALIFRDSFFIALQPYFSRKLKTATFIPERINIQSLKKYITIAKPDIVIDEIIERTHPYLPEKDALP